MKKNIRLIIWFLFLLATMFVLLTPKTFIGNNLHIDKIVHFTVFAILTILSFMAFINLKKSYQILLVILLVTFSFTMEHLQKFIPGRVFSYEDIHANFLGILVGFLIAKIFFKRR